MKNCLIFIMLVFIVSIGFSQNSSGKITYEVTLNFTENDLKELDQKNDEAINTMKKVLKNSTDTDVILMFVANKSFYSVVKKLEINERKPMNMTYAIAGSNKAFYADLNTGKNFMKECELLEKCFLIEQPKLVWQITQETKIIGNYVCYKAINSSSKNKKKKPIAWFTPEISARFGPKEYFGLPGLILELEEAAVVFKAKEIVLNPKENIEIEKMLGTIITKEKYNKKLQKSYSNIYTN